MNRKAYVPPSRRKKSNSRRGAPMAKKPIPLENGGIVPTADPDGIVANAGPDSTVATADLNSIVASADSNSIVADEPAHVAPTPIDNGNPSIVRPSSPNQTVSYGKDRTVKKLRLSKAFTIPEDVTVSDACRRMVHRRAGAVMLTDSDGMLSGILTDKDIAVRVIAEGLKPDYTIVSKVMTRKPVFVTMDTLAIEALQEMIQGKFRHLPIVENGEAIALLDITKCLYDAISRMEKAAEQGSAIAAAVEGVERQWGSDFCSAHYAFIETLRERMFKPSLSTIIMENNKVEVVSPSDSVFLATKRMCDHQVSSVVVIEGGKPLGILTSRDVLMRVVARDLSPELVSVEKVMTTNPDCATMDTSILEALHIMQEGKFLHLPVVDHDGCLVACVDVLQITHAAVSLADEGPGAVNNMANTMIQKFWDTALATDSPDEEYETPSKHSASFISEGSETGKFIYSSMGTGTSFAFKFEDQEGHMHRLSCGTKSLGELHSAVMERLAPGNYQYNTRLLYIDDEGDKILLQKDCDLIWAVNHTRSARQKVLKLHVDYPDTKKEAIAPLNLPVIWKGGPTSLQASVLTGALLLVGIGIMVYLKRSKL